MRSLTVFFLLATMLIARGGELSRKRMETLRLQIFLDEAGFGPGVLDGKQGWVTRQAMDLYERRFPEAVADKAAFQKRLLQAVPLVTVTAIIPRGASKYIDPTLGEEREDQAKRKDMPYRSLPEYLAERYHTTEDMLIELNGRKAVLAAIPGSALVVPCVTPFRIEAVPEKPYKRDRKLSRRSVYVDTAERRLTIYEIVTIKPRGGEARQAWQIVASYPITPGKDEFIRRGEWVMKTCVTWPDWRYDKKLLETGERGGDALIIPGGPNNPVGMIWAGLNRPGIGIHGSSSPRTIGRSRSAGCIRLANWDITRLPQHVRPGASVVIR